MSMTFDPYSLRSGDVSDAKDVLMTNPTALAELEAYWTSLPRRNGVPQRKDVDPTSLAGLLEDCFVLERVAPGVARIRVAGRAINGLLQVEPRGLPLTAAFLPEARVALGRYLEAAFRGPSVVELDIEAPRAVGQPLLKGKLILLPLRDDHGRISRLLGGLVMSGRRGTGGRRFTISEDSVPRIDPVEGLQIAASDEGTTTDDHPNQMPRWDTRRSTETKDRSFLRLVVSND